MINSNDYDDFVVLGGCCEPAFILSELNISQNSYPFDWSMPRYTSADNENIIDGYCNTIENDLEEFDDNPFELKYNQQFSRNYLTLINCNIQFPHFDGNFKNLANKAINLRRLLASDKRVLFIWKSHLDTRLNPSCAIQLVDSIKSKSNVIFNLLIVNEYGTEENLPSKDDYPPECIIYNIIGDINSKFQESNAIHPCDSKLTNSHNWVVKLWARDILE